MVNDEFLPSLWEVVCSGGWVPSWVGLASGEDGLLGGLVVDVDEVAYLGSCNCGGEGM